MENKEKNQVSALPSFKNRRSVLLHLQDAGFKISRAQFYKDCKKGLIRTNPDSSVLESEVRAYATNLKRINGNIEDLNDIQAIKSKKEVEKLEEQIAKLKFEREKDQGKYVPKEDVDRKIISTLTILDVSFRQIMDMNMSDICHILGGDVKKLNNAKDYVDDLLDEMMNKLARTDSFSIKITEN